MFSVALFHSFFRLFCTWLRSLSFALELEFVQPLGWGVLGGGFGGWGHNNVFSPVILLYFVQMVLMSGSYCFPCNFKTLFFLQFQHAFDVTLLTLSAIYKRSWCYALNFSLQAHNHWQSMAQKWLVASACQSPWKRWPYNAIQSCQKMSIYGIPVGLETKSWTGISLRLPAWVARIAEALKKKDDAIIDFSSFFRGLFEIRCKFDGGWGVVLFP